MQPHEATQSTLDYHEARKAREARYNGAAAKLLAASKLNAKTAQSAVVLQFVKYPQADAHCRVWYEKQAYNIAVPRYVISVTRIQVEVVKHFGITMSNMTERGRCAKHAYARQIAFWLAKNMNKNRTLNEIARKFGPRDHTTVMHGIKKIDALVKGDPAVTALVAMLEKRIRA
jgi:chromosomal replication initiation ATPase DnaA